MSMLPLVWNYLRSQNWRAQRKLYGDSEEEGSCPGLGRKKSSSIGIILEEGDFDFIGLDAESWRSSLM